MEVCCSSAAASCPVAAVNGTFSHALLMGGAVACVAAASLVTTYCHVNVKKKGAFYLQRPVLLRCLLHLSILRSVPTAFVKPLTLIQSDRPPSLSSFLIPSFHP